MIAGLGLVAVVLWLDRNRAAGAAESSLLWPTLWYLVVASRPVGVWLMTWGISVPGAAGDPTEGSPIDQYFYGTLTLIGFITLSRRRLEWHRVLRDNPWLTALLVWMALSIAWSQYPYVSFKRLIKVVGSITMALVVLTSVNPLDAIRTVLRRALYVHIPMSIICIKYFRTIGVSWDWNGTTEAWQGIATSKNTLGQIAMLGTLYFLWELWGDWRNWKHHKTEILYLGMSFMLLKGAEDSISVTSASVCLFGVSIFYGLQVLRRRLWAAERFIRIATGVTAAFVLLILAHSVWEFSPDSLFGQLIAKVGRDITISGRTFIWHDVYEVASSNPFFGVGFGGFWIGRIANIPWDAHLTWVLGQAHNGYIDTYLQIGIVGLLILSAALLSGLRRNVRLLADNFDFAALRITLLLTIMFVNVTESTFLRGDHHLWFLLLVAASFVPVRSRASAPEGLDVAAPSRADTVVTLAD